MGSLRSKERNVHDLRDTCDVIVGTAPAHVQRFTVYTDVLTQRSAFFRAARKPEWLEGNATKPVDLSDEDPDVFQAYLNCVYFGPDTLKLYNDEFDHQFQELQTTVVVRNEYLDFDFTDDALLRRTFEEFGDIDNIYGSSSYRRCITFSTASSARKACARFSGSERSETEPWVELFRPGYKGGQSARSDLAGT